MSRVNKMQVILEQITINDVKVWSSKALKTFNNYSVTMTDTNDNIRIS